MQFHVKQVRPCGRKGEGACITGQNQHDGRPLEFCCRGEGRMKRRVSDLIGALTLFGAILPALPADADAIYTYTGFPMEAIIGSAVAGQGFLFSFITPTLLPAHLTLDPDNDFVVVPVISWTADAGPYSVSSSSPNSPTLFDLHFQTDSAGLITGWHIFLDRALQQLRPLSEWAPSHRSL